MSAPHDEARAVAERYARRPLDDRYSPLHPHVLMALQERQRAMRRLLLRAGLRELSQTRLLEVGCGSGGNLLEMLRFGFASDHLIGLELLPERLAQARAALPAGVRLSGGDALQADVPAESQDIVMAATVFSSLLDDDFQQQLAQAMWRWLKPGGAVLWFDFTVDNPRNPDVRGVPVQRLRALFPHARLHHERVTLAPPLARAVCAVHPAAYTLLNLLPMLRTHVMAWLVKPRDQSDASQTIG
ncbi:MAG: class I SAM-dependent methyltransferase [Rubrivivax sp.]